MILALILNAIDRSLNTLGLFNPIIIRFYYIYKKRKRYQTGNTNHLHVCWRFVRKYEDVTKTGKIRIVSKGKQKHFSFHLIPIKTFKLQLKVAIQFFVKSTASYGIDTIFCFCGLQATTAIQLFWLCKWILMGFFYKMKYPHTIKWWLHKLKFFFERLILILRLQISKHIH